MANVQIPETLFNDIIRYYVIITKGGEVPEELDERVYNGLLDKIQKMADRELYTIYKTAPTEEEREKARQKYLDSKGIPESFRW